jgi:hypothetical protein
MRSKLFEQWRDDSPRKRWRYLAGPAAWWVAVAIAVVVNGLFFAGCLVIWLDRDGPGIWAVAAIFFLSIGFVVGVSAVIGRLVRRRGGPPGPA